jgi:hypothetical protein
LSGGGNSSRSHAIATWCGVVKEEEHGHAGRRRRRRTQKREVPAKLGEESSSKEEMASTAMDPAAVATPFLSARLFF